jgi:DNA helicase-2/ATP-dependent DNA helicase PcrA
MDEREEDAFEQALETLNAPQRRAVEHVEGPLLILAGAGSGKTRVITTRIARLVLEEGVAPERILAMTFTNKAADEMRERVDALLDARGAGDAARRTTISTFHSLGARLLRYHSERVGLDWGFNIFDEADQRALVRRLLDARGRETGRSAVRQIRRFIEEQKNAGRTPAQAHEMAFDQMAEDDVFFYEDYQRALRETNCADFGDLILGPLRLFRDAPRLARSYSRQWRYIMVDEFQDTNPAQYELLRHLTSEHDNLAVVGDDDQAIYRWRGATIENILGFEDDYPSARVVKLEQNYRSTQVILDAAHDVIERNRRRRDKTLWTDRSGGEAITCFCARDDREEADWVARKVEEHVHRDGGDYRDVAVFFRINAQARLFEERLRYRGVPYQVVGGTSFYAREEIKDLLAYLKVALNPADDVDLLRVINVPSRSVGAGTVERLEAAARVPGVDDIFSAVRAVVDATDPIDEGLGRVEARPEEPEHYEALERLESLRSDIRAGVETFYEIVLTLRDELLAAEGPDAVLRLLLERIHYFDYLEERFPDSYDDRQRNVAELVNATEEFARDFEADEELIPFEDPEILDAATGRGVVDVSRAAQMLRAFLDRSALIQSTDMIDEARGAVTLMTVHGSKGLEFPVVFLVGMEEELFPSLREDDDPEELAEERRLAYVAITRAERKLYLTQALRRRVYGKWRDTRPSRFLLDIDEERLELDPSSARPRRGRGRGDSGFGGRSGRGSGRGFQAMPAGGTSEWEYDQSAQIVGGSAEEMERAAAEAEDAFFSQLPPDEWGEGAHGGQGGMATAAHSSPSVEEGGDLVGRAASHSRFGIGEIVEVRGSGDRARLTVDFPTAGVKTVMRRFLKILR